MPQIEFLHPVDQFTGQQRLLPQLQKCLTSVDYQHFRFAVAFAKSGPLLRLALALEAWHDAGKIIEAIIGIDHLGTSRQALELALQYCDQVFITHVEATNGQRATFHPKLYLFDGSQHAVCFYGSHNLTVGGTETNLEGGVRITYALPAEANAFGQALASWESLLPVNFPSTHLLDATLLNDLVRQGWLLDETRSTMSHPPRPVQSGASSSAAPLFRPVYVLPPSAIPRTSIARPRRARPTPTMQPTPTSAPPFVPQALVIQIVPRVNGEVFLSKGAVNQNPAFFGWPFTGHAQPKRNSNLPYPQRDPDPIVNIRVFDTAGNLVTERLSFALNAVYYERKGEIRITISATLATLIPHFSTLVMAKDPPTAPTEYTLSVFAPGSTQYTDYLQRCTQFLPSGGAAQGRRMGWL